MNKDDRTENGQWALEHFLNRLHRNCREAINQYLRQRETPEVTHEQMQELGTLLSKYHNHALPWPEVAYRPDTGALVLTYYTSEKYFVAELDILFMHDLLKLTTDTTRYLNNIYNDRVWASIEDTLCP